MKITRENLMNLFGVLNALGSKEMKAKAAYGLAKNKTKVESEIKAIQEAQQKIQPSAEAIKFNEERIKLCEEFSNKDEDGKAIEIGLRYDIPAEKIEAFEAKVEEVKEKYKEALEEKEKKEEEWMELMKEEVEVDIHRIHIDLMPDTITPQQIETLGEIIIDE